MTVILERLTGAFALNCELFFLTLLFSLPLGLVVAFGSMSRCAPLRGVVKTFVWVIRGTPLMLQIIVIYLGPGLLGMTNPWPSGSSGRLVAAVVAFAINYACYFSEIYRGGIEDVPKGQTEAGQVLGMTRSQIFFKVTLLQVVKRILPPMGNEVITLVKDTSLANVIANKEIIMMAKEYSAKGLIWPLFSTAIFFLVLSAHSPCCWTGPRKDGLFPLLRRILNYGITRSLWHREEFRRDESSQGHLAHTGTGRGAGHHRLVRLGQDDAAALPEFP